MSLVYRELTREEQEALAGLGLKNPWADGPAMFGDRAAVDVERGVVVVAMGGGNLGGGNLGAANYWALVVGTDVLVLRGEKGFRSVHPADPRLIVWVDRGVPGNSPLWHIPDLYKLLKQGLFMVVTVGDTYEPGRIWFRGLVGDLVENA
ncbi:MAG: hypothetical protein LBC97_12260 [Bifidobacteriaceae bacterium]|jgi:hypothetical protein|nr:hypothetical protein [Bifidobacteriaceae bacterium]